MLFSAGNMRQADWDQGIPFEIMGDIFKLAPGSINAARQVSTTWRAGANQFITKIKVAYSERPKETDPPPITGAALNARFSRITHLDIGESKLAPAELEDLAPGCTKVTNLTLGARKSPGKNFPHTIESKPPEFPKGILAVRVRTEGLQFLQNFQVLRCLDLRGCTSLADAGLQRMAGLHLDELVIVRSKHLTDFGMVHLSGMMTLKRLTLEQITKLTADGVRCLRGLELVWLSLRGCISLKNDTVSVLNEMRTLEHLSLEGCHGLDTRCLAPLSGPNPEGPPKKLTSLNLGLLAKPTVNCLRSLLSTNAPPLKYLYLDGCTDMHGGYRTFKSGEFANVLDLEELSVARWTYWDDESMKSVANLYKLTSFNVEGCRRLTAAGLVHLKGKKLKKLDLRRCNMLTAAGIEHLRGMPLEWLYLRRCVELTDAALEHLRDMRLRELDLRRCTKITDEGLKVCAVSRPFDLLTVQQNVQLSSGVALRNWQRFLA